LLSTYNSATQRICKLCCSSPYFFQIYCEISNKLINLTYVILKLKSIDSKNYLHFIECKIFAIQFWNESPLIYTMHVWIGIKSVVIANCIAWSSKIEGQLVVYAWIKTLKNCAYLVTYNIFWIRSCDLLV